MTRETLTSGNRAQASAKATSTIWFLRIEFATGTVALNTSERDHTFGGTTYIGDGRLRSIGDVDESLNLRQDALELIISGLDQSLMDAITDDSYHYRRVDIFVGFRDLKTGKLITGTDPHPLMENGLLSQPAILLAERAGEITITVENRAILLKKKHSVMATDAMQQLRAPGDTGLKLIHLMEDTEIVWGESPPLPGGRPDRDGELFPVEHMER